MILLVDCGFILMIYPLIALLLLQVRTLFLTYSYYKLFKIIAYAQIIAATADLTENIVLSQSLNAGFLTIPNGMYQSIELIKWGISGMGVLLFVVASVQWSVRFFLESRKASAGLGY